MTIEAELVTFLTVTDGTVSGIIGTKMYPSVAGQKAKLPYITYNRITTDRLQSLTGSSDLPDARFQFSCFDDDAVGVITLSEAVRAALNDFSGAMGAVTVQHATLEDEGDLPAIEIGDSQRRTFGRRLDFTISYNEA